ncbi:hypothetical protein FDI24_gp001 [Acidovorax phage ACP17]|uniref:Uncharacterized protein n=1 Tax=Acidovorax phage ACP17 TaxID=2010329 RepID=A0A218M3B8_9CAUD|nr:hypothetical protein FDI24_gp001 [Acidovorax phage ACP17]ASD50535.1 hypothetical protein [Acidovorax phage ACP17]
MMEARSYTDYCKWEKDAEEMGEIFGDHPGAVCVDPECSELIGEWDDADGSGWLY